MYKIKNLTEDKIVIFNYQFKNTEIQSDESPFEICIDSISMCFEARIFINFPKRKIIQY